METGTILAGFSLAIAGLTAWNSSRRTKIDDRSGAVAELQTVVDALSKENERLKKKLDDMEAGYLRRIEKLEAEAEGQQETINRQANRITELERRGDAKTRTRAGDKEA